MFIFCSDPLDMSVTPDSGAVELFDKVVEPTKLSCSALIDKVSQP